MSEITPLVILCVDDDPIGLTTRRMLLTAAGYQVITAVSGAGALRMLRRKQVNLVITDYFLPGMTGSELAAAVKLRNPKTPVMLLTGALELPPGSEQADLVITKGVAPSDFLAAIAKLAAQRQASAT